MKATCVSFMHVHVYMILYFLDYCYYCCVGAISTGVTSGTSLQVFFILIDQMVHISPPCLVTYMYM